MRVLIAEALWMASEFAYDAMVLDLMLPKVNGFVLRSRSVNS